MEEILVKGQGHAPAARLLDLSVHHVHIQRGLDGGDFGGVAVDQRQGVNAPEGVAGPGRAAPYGKESVLRPLGHGILAAILHIALVWLDVDAVSHADDSPRRVGRGGPDIFGDLILECLRGVLVEHAALSVVVSAGQIRRQRL